MYASVEVSSDYYAIVLFGVELQVGGAFRAYSIAMTHMIAPHELPPQGAVGGSGTGWVDGLGGQIHPEGGAMKISLNFVTINYIDN